MSAMPHPAFAWFRASNNATSGCRSSGAARRCRHDHRRMGMDGTPGGSGRRWPAGRIRRSGTESARCRTVARAPEGAAHHARSRPGPHRRHQEEAEPP